MLEDVLLLVFTVAWFFGVLVSSGWQVAGSLLSPVYAYYVLGETVYWAYFYTPSRPF